MYKGCILSLSCNKYYYNFIVKILSQGDNMQITSRFTIAVHLITCIDHFSDRERVNSEFLAGSTGVNPVMVRQVISMLRKAGIVETTRGSSGARLAKPLSEVTFYDIYEAVDSAEAKDGLFHFHENPNPDCPVGKNIHNILDEQLLSIQNAMEDQMRQITLADIAKKARTEILKDAE